MKTWDAMLCGLGTLSLALLFIHPATLPLLQSFILYLLTLDVGH